MLLYGLSDCIASRIDLCCYLPYMHNYPTTVQVALSCFPSLIKNPPRAYRVKKVISSFGMRHIGIFVVLQP